MRNSNKVTMKSMFIHQVKITGYRNKNKAGENPVNKLPRFKREMVIRYIRTQYMLL